MPRWIEADLTDLADAPDADGTPFAYVTQFDSAPIARVVYRDRDSHIRELRLEQGGTWRTADLTDLADAPDATGDPVAYVTHLDAEPTARVVFLGADGHIHELWLQAGGSWHHADLCGLAHAPDAAGPPFGYVTRFGSDPTARVVYRGGDGHIHELWLETGGSWHHADLTDQANAPDAAGSPVAYLTPFDSRPTARVLYRGQDAHIHELRLEPGESWQRADLTDLANAPDATGDPVGYVTDFDPAPTARVVYRGDDRHIHELWLEAGDSWHKADLTDLADSSNAEGGPFAYVTPLDSRPTARVLYRGGDSHIHELRLEEGGSWRKADLTDLADAPDADGDPFAYVTDFDSETTPRVLYRGRDSHIHEVRLASR